jgi:hypothetical protein
MSGRCVAGRTIVGNGFGDWVRPVSARENAEISFDDRRYQNGQDPKLLDVISIPMIEPRPHDFQTENHLIDAQYYWEFQRHAAWAEAVAAVDGQGRPLWSNDSSGYNGVHDRVAEEEALPADGSLRLIEVPNLEVRVGVEGAAFGNGKRRVRGLFTHFGAQYLLSITDPTIEARFLAQPDGHANIGRALLCVSLGEPYQGYAYKLIAGVIQPPN